MPEPVANPRARAIIKAAKQAHETSGADFDNQLPHWTVVQNDPGKSWFWRCGLIEAGMTPNNATVLVNRLDQAKRGW